VHCDDHGRPWLGPHLPGSPLRPTADDDVSGQIGVVMFPIELVIDLAPAHPAVLDS
jgi:hypothetical protein